MALMFPPAPHVAVSTGDLVAGGRLFQRELVTNESLGKSGAERGLATRQLAREVWEGWDRDSVLRPLAFYVGFRETHRVEGSYPMPLAEADASSEWVEAGYVFRDETDFRPWSDYEYTIDADSQIQPLYSEWQLLALPLVIGGDYMSVPVTVLAEGETTLLEWETGMRRELAKSHAGGRQMATTLLEIRCGERHHGRLPVWHPAGQVVSH